MPFKAVTESRLILLTTLQTNNSRDELLGQGIVTIQKVSRLRRWWTCVPKSEFRFLLYQKGKECGWLLETSCCRNPLFLPCSYHVHIGVVTMFL